MHITANQSEKPLTLAPLFSGIGRTFFPLDVQPEPEPFTLHESGFTPRRHHWTYTSVFSAYWRLYYDFEEGHRIVFPDKEVIMGPDRILIIPDHQLMQFIGEEPRPKLWVTFSCPRRFASDQAIPAELPVTQAELALMEELKKLILDKKHEETKNRILHWSLALLHITLNRPDIHWQEDKPEKLLQCLRYIEEHYGQPISNPELAGLAHISLRSLVNMFQQYQGISPAQHIRQVRVRMASKLLLHTEKSIDEIAEEAGFGTRAYLSRVFTQATGFAPANFRHTQGNPDNALNKMPAIQAKKRK
jgi:AraC-like DNA-binding protein